MSGTADGPEPVEVVAGEERDLPGIVAILNAAVLGSDADFGTRPVTVAERRPWFAQFATTGPYRLFVARCDGRVAGYAASRPYRSHEAFRETVEVGVAVADGYRGRNVGSSLYQALFNGLTGEAVHVAVAGIALPNDASVALHRRIGFTEVGTFREYAIKNGRYISSLWMQRFL